MKTFFKIYIYLAVAFTSAQVEIKYLDLPDPSIWQDFTYDMGNIVKGTVHTYVQPLSWQVSDLVKLGSVAGGTMALYVFDQDIQHEFRNLKANVPPLLLDYGWYAGSPQNNYGFTGAIYFTGLFTQNEKLRRTGVLLITSATAAGFLQQLTKSGVGRARPGANLGKDHFRPFGGSASYRSFPSGHAVLTFTNAHVIAKQFKSWWIKGPIYTLGLVPGISRIFVDAHWASDVFLSWAMSYFVVEAIDHYLDKKYSTKYNDSEDKKTSLNLTLGAGSVSFTYKF